MVETMKIMVTSFKRSHAGTVTLSAPKPCNSPLPAHDFAGDSWTLTGKSGPVSCGGHCFFTHLWNLKFWWSHYFKLMRWYMWKQLETDKCFNKIQSSRKSLITPKSDEKSSWFHWHLAYDKGCKTEIAQPMASGRCTVPNPEMDSLPFPQQGRQEEFSRENPGGRDAEAEKGTTDASSHF